MTPQLSYLIHFVLRNYLSSSCILIFAEEFTYSGLNPSVKLNVGNDTFERGLVANQYFGCQGILIVCSNPIPIFTKFEHQIRKSNDRFNNRKYLIVTEGNEIEFSKLQELDYVRDLLLITPKSEGYDLSTHRYVGTTRNNEFFLLDKFFTSNMSFMIGDNLFPDKVTNQQGRPLRMATFSYEPYSIVGDSIEKHHGSELTSAVQFALKYNMTPVPVVNEEYYWGEIYPNWTGIGLLGNLVYDKADVGFSALYTWEISYHYLDLSKPVVRTAVTCLVPAPKLIPGWLTPLYSYSNQIWLCIGVTSLLATLTIAVCLFFENENADECLVSRSVFMIYKPLLLQSLINPEIPTRPSCKIVLASILVVTIFLTSIYSSGLASIMTIPRYLNAIETVEEFANSDLEWGATQEAWITSIENTTNENYQKIVGKFKSLPEDVLREKSLYDQFGFSVERLPFDDYAIGDYIKEDAINKFHLMQQDLYWEYCVVMLRKNSVLLPELDDFLLKIAEAGLISQWQQKAVALYMNPYVQKAVKYYRANLREHPAVQLKWTHVEGAFAILSIGHLLSTIIFIIEKYSKKDSTGEIVQIP